MKGDKDASSRDLWYYRAVLGTIQESLLHSVGVCTVQCAVCAVCGVQCAVCSQSVCVLCSISEQVFSVQCAVCSV